MTDSLPFKRVAVVGAGTMGHGIAQVCAQAGCGVRLFDVDQASVQNGLTRIKKNLDKGVEKGKVDAQDAERALTRIDGTIDLGMAVDEADLVIEAIPETLSIKAELFARLAGLTEEGAVYATNTSSLSIAQISEAAPDPSRVIGMHFFNPVHIMALLEVVHHTGTDPQVVNDVLTFGKAIGKETILVKDSPGFATSRLGVCLGMEAIRMLQDGVASAEDIDKAMVLGYRHPIGPLKLTDLVGLDIRMSIGEYLAEELDNSAFSPPRLMREMVKNGVLGKKTGKGFYEW